MLSCASFLICRMVSMHSLVVGFDDRVGFHSMRGWYPYSNSNGVFFVVAFGHELRVNCASGSHVDQLSCLVVVQNHKYCSRHWFVLSNCLSVWG